MTRTPHPEPGADAARPCEYCGEPVQYIGTDHDMDGDYVAEYWCDNCKEYLHYVLPDPQPTPEILYKSGSYDVYYDTSVKKYIIVINGKSIEGRYTLDSAQKVADKFATEDLR